MYTATGDSEHSIKANRRALEFTPTAVIPQFNLAVALLQNDEFGEALTYFDEVRKAVEIAPNALPFDPSDLGKLHLFRGHCLAGLQDPDAGASRVRPRYRDSYVEQASTTGISRGGV